MKEEKREEKNIIDNKLEINTPHVSSIERGAAGMILNKSINAIFRHHTWSHAPPTCGGIFDVLTYSLHAPITFYF
jgi:hypothetical protein